MTTESAPAPDEWRRGQRAVIAGLFEDTLDEMQAKGFRLKTGSTTPCQDDTEEIVCASIMPARFSCSPDGSLLRLSLEATTRNYGARYVCRVAASGELPLDSLSRLVSANAEVWEKAYLRAGLWLIHSGGTSRLERLRKGDELGGRQIEIAAVFPALQSSRTIQQAIKLLGVLYRSTMDEFSGSSRMVSLVNRLSVDLGGFLPKFQQTLPP